MRFSLLIFATLASLAAAQNSTGSDTDVLADCTLQCSEKAMDANPESAQKCLNTTTEVEQATCICHEQGLLNALQSCIDTTCPEASKDIDLHKACKRADGSAPRIDVAILPAIAASGALAISALLF